MSTFIPPTPAANKSAEQHQERSEQDSFNHLLYKVLRLTSEQVQDLNDWMAHQGIPNVHEVIAQNFRKPNALEDNLKFITQSKTCYIQSNGDFNERIIANLNILLDAPPEDCGSYTEISSVFTANLRQSSPQEPDWNALHPFLHGHSQSASRTLSMSPPGMGLLHTPRITSKSTLSLAILFSTSPDAVKLLQQTPSSLTLLLLMMVQPWPNSSVAMILLSVMPMA